MGYDLVVFDADHHPPIAEVKQQGTKVLAYLSLAELDPHRDYTERFLSEPGMKIGDNERWKSHVIDIRKPQWQHFVANEWLPTMLAKGFDGIFIDTIDTALEVQRLDNTYTGTDQAVRVMVQQIRRNMPIDKLIMVNRGFGILPDIAADIDIILAESILVDAMTPGRPFFPVNMYRQYVNKLQSLRQKYSHLSIFTLDYPETIDKTAWLQICKEHKKQGFVPYISTIDLHQIKPPFERCGY